MRYCEKCGGKIGFFECAVDGMHYRCYQDDSVNEKNDDKEKKHEINIDKKSEYCVRCGAELELDESFCINCRGSNEYNKFLYVNIDQLKILKTEETSKNDFMEKEKLFTDYCEKFNSIENLFLQNNQVTNDIEGNEIFCYECGFLNNSNAKICEACGNLIEVKKETSIFGDSIFVRKMFETKYIVENNKIVKYNELCKELIKIICLALINDKKSFEMIRIIKNSFIYKLKIFDIFQTKLNIAMSTLDVEEESYSKHILVAIEGLKKHNYFLYYFSIYAIVTGLNNFRRKFYDDYSKIKEILEREFNIKLKEEKNMLSEFFYECENTIMPSTDMMISHKSDYYDLRESKYSDVSIEYLKSELGRCQDANKLREFIEHLDRYISSLKYESDVLHKDKMECAKECLVDALLFDFLVNNTNWNKNFSKYLLRATISYCKSFENYSENHYTEIVANKIYLLLEKIGKVAAFKKNAFTTDNIELYANIFEFFYNLACYFEDYPIILSNIRAFTYIMQSCLMDPGDFGDERSFVAKEIHQIIKNMVDRYAIEKNDKLGQMMLKLEGNIYEANGYWIIENDAMKKAQIFDIVKKIDRVLAFVKREEINYFGASITMESRHITRKLLAIASEEERVRILVDVKKYLLPKDFTEVKWSINNEKLKKEIELNASDSH